MAKERLTGNDNMVTMLTKMTDGNPGSMNALMQLMSSATEAKKIDPENALGVFGYILTLDSSNVYGANIYLLFNDICRKQLVKFLAVIRGLQLGIVSRELIQDIESNKNKINVDDIYTKVREQLPSFDKTEEKLYEVIMLPVKTGSKFGLVHEDNKIYDYPNEPDNPNGLIDNLIILQHLHIVTDEILQPENGQYFIDMSSKTVHKYEGYGFAPGVDKVILASTDTDLQLSVITTEFVAKFKKAYNHNEPIKTASLESSTKPYEPSAASILNPKNVEDTFYSLLYSKEEIPADGSVPADCVRVSGVKLNAGFHPGRLKEKTDFINQMVEQLPSNFKTKAAGGGDGWSFLEMLNDKDGNQWTGLHDLMDMLLCMGLATGKLKYMMEDRTKWPDLFYGGMPYVVMN